MFLRRRMEGKRRNEKYVSCMRISSLPIIQLTVSGSTEVEVHSTIISLRSYNNDMGKEDEGRQVHNRNIHVSINLCFQIKPAPPPPPYNLRLLTHYVILRPSLQSNLLALALMRGFSTNFILFLFDKCFQQFQNGRFLLSLI